MKLKMNCLRLPNVFKKAKGLIPVAFFLFSAILSAQDPISIDDVSQVETDAGTTTFLFTVSVDGGGTATAIVFLSGTTWSI